MEAVNWSRCGHKKGRRERDTKETPKILNWTTRKKLSYSEMKKEHLELIGRNSPFGCLSSTIGICKSKCLTKGSKKEAKKKPSGWVDP